MIFENLKSTFDNIEKDFSKEQKKEFMKYDFRYVVEDCHFGFGTWLRNNILTQENYIYQRLYSAGICEKDDMSAIVTFLFFLYLKDKYNG